MFQNLFSFRIIYNLTMIDGKDLPTAQLNVISYWQLCMGHLVLNGQVVTKTLEKVREH